MKINEQEFNKSAELLREVRLTESEKDSMLSSIYQTEITAEPQSVASPFILSSIFMRGRGMVIMASFVFLMAGGAAAAAGSLPGDSLYGIKVNVLEPIALQLTFEDAAKNEYKMELLRKRVAELQELRLNPDMDPRSEEDSYRAAERIIAKLEASGIFDDKEINVDVITHVETYNSLISEHFRLETKVMRNILMPEMEDEEDNENDKEEQGTQKETESIREAVTKTKKSLDDIEGVAKKVEEEAEDIESQIKKEVSKTIKGVTNPY